MNSVTTIESDSDSITLKKLAKGYGWEIKCYGKDVSEILDKVDKADRDLKSKYGSEQ
jgi:hypothetical protein